MKWVEKHKKINFTKWIGLLLLVAALIIWGHSIIELKSNEIMLSTQNLSIQETRAYAGALQWWQNAYTSAYLPTTGILTLAGIVTLLSQQFLKFVQKITLKNPTFFGVIEKTLPKKDNLKKEPIEVLQNLIDEEAILKKEKKKLASFQKKLQLSVQKEIQTKKNNIKKLRSEINDLKFFCEEFSKSPRTNTKMN